jgi:hypothetical protein
MHRTTWRTLTCVLLMPLGASAGTILIDTRDGLITHPGGGPLGSDLSVLQDAAPIGLGIYGFIANDAVGARVADDVTFATDVDVRTITVYAYQTNSTSTPTFDNLRLRIWNGPPDAGGIVVFGDSVNNRFGGATFTNIYRTLQSSPTVQTNRPIMAITSVPLNVTLDAGTYWIDVSLGGTLPSGPWVAPLTSLGFTSAAFANALQITSTGGSWAPAADGTRVQGFAFTIEGVGVTPVDPVFENGFE